MHSFKFFLEKPYFIWVLIAITYGAVFWFSQGEMSISAYEYQVHDLMHAFSENVFPPKIALVRELGDWGHLGFYALWGRFYRFVGGDFFQLRAFSTVMSMLFLLVFIRLGYHFTYRNRLNPLWISLSLVVMAANPYLWTSAFTLGYEATFLFFLLSAVLLFEKENFFEYALVMAFAVLIDFRALIFHSCMVAARVLYAQSRVLRFDRFLYFVFPFLIATLVLFTWQGIVPQGAAEGWWMKIAAAITESGHAFKHSVRIDTLFYQWALLPVYGFYFVWTWGLRARSRALTIGAILAAILIPLYFVFPIEPDFAATVLQGESAPLGHVDALFLRLAGPYKNLVLFVPWLLGAFLFLQLLLMDVLERTKWMRYALVALFLIQPFILYVGDRSFLLCVPFLLLFSLSEALVGEEGKLA